MRPLFWKLRFVQYLTCELARVAWPTLALHMCRVCADRSPTLAGWRAALGPDIVGGAQYRLGGADDVERGNSGHGDEARRARATRSARRPGPPALTRAGGGRHRAMRASCVLTSREPRQREPATSRQFGAGEPANISSKPSIQLNPPHTQLSPRTIFNNDWPSKTVLADPRPAKTSSSSSWPS
jgi:hypothetical protein